MFLPAILYPWHVFHCLNIFNFASVFLMLKYTAVFIFIAACVNRTGNSVSGDKVKSSFNEIHGRVDETIAGRHIILINHSDSMEKQPVLLVLPGWNFAADRWLKETNLEKLATENGFTLVLPEMSRSIYATHYYEETDPDMRSQPTGKWLIDTLIPVIQQKYNILRPDQFNAVLGLSTGGRGVLYCLLHSAVIFKAGIAFSGDYDQTAMPADRLMTSVYGDSKKFPLRWHWDDNMMSWASSIYQPLYIAHGLNDNVVPPQQSITLANRLGELHHQQKIITSFPKGMGHDFKFWGAALGPAMQFLKEENARTK
jgi:S-formylglutathione hydrolase FrmB